jgi:NADH:ubiquinone oxidoreductase subunit 6 (subunit J)
MDRFVFAVLASSRSPARCRRHRPPRGRQRAGARALLPRGGRALHPAGRSSSAPVQILLYAGSIVVLFVFVVMLGQSAGRREGGLAGRGVRRLLLAGVVLAQLLAVFARAGGWLAARAAGSAPGEGHIQVLGKVLFRDYLLPFEILSVILLAALFGLIVIGRRK